MIIRFNEFIPKAGQITGCNTQMELAKILEVNRSAITQAKNRDAVPERWLLTLARKYSLPPDWFETGVTTPYTALPRAEIARIYEPEPDYNPEVVNIPKVSAVLCAGGGSFEVESAVVDHIPLPLNMARSFGHSDKLVFMDVSGDSMEPYIHGGDVVLIDQSVSIPVTNTVMAVGHEDSIYIKRIQMNKDGSLSLVSDNPAYTPINLMGDDLQTFRVIGKLVWLCRDLH